MLPRLPVFAALLSAIGLAACAGGAATTGGTAPAPAETPPGLAGLASPRAVAAHTPPPITLKHKDGRLLLGAYALQQSECVNVTADGRSALFSPAWTTAETHTRANLALAVYALDLTSYTGGDTLRLSWETEPHRARYFVGLGNYLHDYWEWHRGTSLMDGALDIGDVPTYTSSSNQLTVAVVVLGDEPAVLESVELGERWIVEGVDLTLLFAPPVDMETQAVEDDWADRLPLAADYVVEAESEAPDGFRTLIVSHTVDELKHYGAFRIPAHGPGAKLPLFLLCHAGGSGVGTHEFERIDILVGDAAVRDSYIMVLPSFRGEPLFSNEGVFTSEGPGSFYNRDADDAIALLDCAIKYLPEADPDLVVVEGTSRGAQVAQRVAQRDDRVDGVIVFYGMVDFWVRGEQEWFVSQLTAAAAGEPAAGYVLGLYEGDFTIWDVREAMLYWSTSYYADRFPRLQAHYGALDESVPVEQGDRLNSVLLALQHDDFEYFRYPTGVHNPASLPGCGARMQVMLAELLLGD